MGVQSCALPTWAGRCAITAAAVALAAVVARRPAVERSRQNREPGRNAGDVQLVRGLLDQQLVAARARRRLEYAVRLVGEILFAAEQADQPVDLVVIGGLMVVRDGPCGTQAIPALPLEVVRAEAERDPAPVVGAAPHHAGPPPVELGARGAGVRLAFDLPAADARVEFAERMVLGRPAAPRRLVRPGEHGRVFQVVPRHPGLEDDHVGAGAREGVGGHAPPGARADDAHVVYSGLGARGCGLGHTVQVSTACRNEVSGSRVGVNSCATNPVKPVSAMAAATACQLSSCVPSSSWRPGTPPVWKCPMNAALSRMVRMMSPSIICMW